jgi:hypothetical protein
VTKSYTEDEWLGIEPVYSLRISDEPDDFDWDGFEARKGQEEVTFMRKKAMNEAEYFRTHKAYPLRCHCGAPSDIVYVHQDATVEEIQQATSRVVPCWLHDRGEK